MVTHLHSHAVQLADAVLDRHGQDGRERTVAQGSAILVVGPQLAPVPLDPRVAAIPFQEKGETLTIPAVDAVTVRSEQSHLAVPLVAARGCRGTAGAAADGRDAG